MGKRVFTTIGISYGHKLLSVFLVLTMLFSSASALAEGVQGNTVLFEGDGMFQADSFFGPQDNLAEGKTVSRYALRAARISKEDMLYREILSAMDSCEVMPITYEKNFVRYTGDAIKLNIFGYDYANTSENMEKVYYLYAKAVNSNPRYFYYIPNAVFVSSDGTLSDFYMLVSMNAYNQREAYETEITKMIAEAVPDASGMSQTEIALAVHDYLVTHTCYDWEAFYSSDRYINYPDSFSAYGAIVNKRAVCQGLSLAYMDMLSRLGMQCAIVPSYTLGHAWNLVYADGVWYHADITNAGDISNLGRVKHNYFMLSDDESRAIHYGTWSSDGLAEAAEPHNNKGFWNDVESAMYYIDGYWYFNDGIVNSQLRRCEGTLERTRYGAFRSSENLFSNVSFPVRLNDDLIYCNYSDNTLDTYNPSTGQILARRLSISGQLSGIGIGVSAIGAPMPPGYMRFSAGQSAMGYFCYSDSLGDINADSSVNVKDLLLMERLKSAGNSYDTLTCARADVDWNAAVDEADSEYLQSFIVRLSKKLPALY